MFVPRDGLLVAGVFALRAEGGPHESWRRRIVPELSRRPTFRAVLHGPLGYAPDFLTPPPRTGRPAFADELAEVAATPLDVVAAQVTAGWAGHTPPPEIDRFARDPAAGLARLVAEIRAYADVAVRPLWPRLRAVAATEIAGRGRIAAEHGARRLVDGLHPRLGWDGAALQLRYPHKSGRWSLDGHQLTLLPTGFAGGEVYAMPDSPAGRTLWYGPRGFGNVWATGPAPDVDARLSALLGPTRVGVLTLLAAPHSTGDVAGRLGLSAGTASHHLTTLRDAGLATAVRSGRRMLYERTALGDQLTQRLLSEGE